MRSYWISVGLNPMPGDIGTQTHTHREGGREKRDAETGVMLS